MFQEILFPVDFSERCQQFAAEVAMMAREWKARVTLLHIIELSHMFYTGAEAPMYTSLIDISRFREDGKEQLRTMRDTYFAKLPVVLAQEEGLPAERILRYTKGHPIDLIMMPTHGCGLFRRALLGSVTAKLIHDSPIPVWTSSHRSQDPPVAPQVPQLILAAIDESKQSAAVMQLGERLAECLHAQFAAVHATTHAAAAAASGGRSSETGVSVEAGDVAAVVTREAERRQAGLLVLGRGHAQERMGGVRTHLYQIIQQAPCSVLSA